MSDGKGVRAFYFSLTALNVGFAVLAVYFIFRGGATPEAGTDISYMDLVVIILTALGVMLATLGFGVALAAVWGYNAIKEMTIVTAEKEARKVAAEEGRKAARAALTRVQRTMIGQVGNPTPLDASTYGNAASEDEQERKPPTD